VFRLHQADATIGARNGVGRPAKLVYTMKTARFVVAILALAPGCFVMGQTNGTSCIADHYKVIALPLRPAHVNEARQVAGTTIGHRAALWTEQSGLHELPLPEAFYNSEAAAVNNSGHVTGVAYDRAFSQHRAFTFANGALALLPGEQSHPYNISDSDEIAGESVLPGKTSTEPVVWIGAAIRSLGGCCGGSAKAANNDGEVIGDVYDKDGRYQAFLWTGAGGLQIIGPPDRYSSAIAINAQGHVVVQAFSEVFLYSGGSLAHVDLSSRYPSHPREINSCDVMVGSFGPFADAERAFIWDKSRGFRDLNSSIASDSGWILESATSINDHGEIVGRGDYKSHDDTGFLLIPER
jgi:probable HAF family extracellular repeat protein